METGRIAALCVVTLVAGTLVATGPAVGFEAITDVGSTGGLGEGTASVEHVDFDDEQLRIEPGRFGSGVYYLRTPSITVEMSRVVGRPRLVYVVKVPRIGFRGIATELLAADGAKQVTVGMSDRAFDRRMKDGKRYRATVTVRVQSFTTDDVVFRRNATVEVQTDG